MFSVSFTICSLAEQRTDRYNERERDIKDSLVVSIQQHINCNSEAARRCWCIISYDTRFYAGCVLCAPLTCVRLYWFVVIICERQSFEASVSILLLCACVSCVLDAFVCIKMTIFMQVFVGLVVHTQKTSITSKRNKKSMK